VLLFIFVDGSEEPTLVAKVPRLADQCEFLDREVRNLRALQEMREGGWDTVPRVISYEEHAGTPILLETIVTGQTMGPAYVRSRPEACLRSVVAWLANLHGEAARSDRTIRLGVVADRDLEPFADLFPAHSPEARLVERTRALVEPIADCEVPLVFEHGDLSSPNLLIDENDRVGVVDWELANANGLPAADLFFFLAYVAFARARARSTPRCTTAFRRAFLGADAWAWRWVEPYADRLRLEEDSLKALFLLTWSRYLATTVTRLGGGASVGDGRGSELSDWLRGNRFYALWKDTIENWDSLAVKRRSRAA
jgi:aminoglycoside phosphotransferase (APT) family kinase protein